VPEVSERCLAVPLSTARTAIQDLCQRPTTTGMTLVQRTEHKTDTAALPQPQALRLGGGGPLPRLVGVGPEPCGRYLCPAVAQVSAPTGYHRRPHYQALPLGPLCDRRRRRRGLRGRCDSPLMRLRPRRTDSRKALSCGALQGERIRIEGLQYPQSRDALRSQDMCFGERGEFFS
jgi:hypothetical protein